MKPGPLVLVVDDELQMRRFLRASLTSRDFTVVEAASAQEALSQMVSRNPEIVLLDLGLPDQDGVEWTRSVREWSHTPIIVISAREQEGDKVKALDAGADDYLTKPFGLNELLARMRVALRHAEQTGAAEPPVLDVGPLQLDLARRQVTIDGRELRLTPIEYRILSLLARNAGKVLTHSYILREVWGPGHTQQTHYLRVYMAQLRRKLQADLARPHLLTTEPGVGYRLRDGASSSKPDR
jgi:two-component system, OmpR family, KDP operon response regulator KdpE